MVYIGLYRPLWKISLFISKEEFLKRKEENGFLECDEHFGNFYGTPIDFVKEKLKTHSVILEIDVVGGLNAKKLLPECLLTFIAPPSVEELKRRLSGRQTETPEQIEKRLERVDFEMQKASEYDYVVVNDELEKAVQRISDIIDIEKTNSKKGVNKK